MRMVNGMLPWSKVATAYRARMREAITIDQVKKAGGRAQRKLKAETEKAAEGMSEDFAKELLKAVIEHLRREPFRRSGRSGRSEEVRK